MSNTQSLDTNQLEKLTLDEKLKLREMLDQNIADERPKIIFEKYLDIASFLQKNGLDLKSFCEIGERQYTATNKRKKPPISFPTTTGAERKLEVKFSDGVNNWAGRGKVPRWLRDHINDGREMHEFAVQP